MKGIGQSEVIALGDEAAMANHKCHVLGTRECVSASLGIRERRVPVRYWVRCRLCFYRVQAGEKLTAVGLKFQTTEENILAANPSITDVNHRVTGSSLFISFSCDCINNQLLH